MRLTNISVCTLLSLYVLSSCTVKEDRTECPCRLEILLDESSGNLSGKDILLWFSEDSGHPLRKTSFPSSEKQMTADVPRGKIRIFAATGDNVSMSTGQWNHLHLEPGLQADSIFACNSIVECFGEMSTDTLILHKQWCTAHILLEETGGWEPFRFEIYGKWSGLSADDLTALEGPFRYQSDATARQMTVRIPRQGDDSLVLKVHLTQGNQSDSKTFPLGKLIAEIGYQWDKTDLDDLAISLDEATLGLNIEIIDWESSGPDREINF